MAILSRARRFLWLRRVGLVDADRIKTHMTQREKDVLFKLAKVCRTDALEIGSYMGASSCFLAAGLGPHRRLFCVDTWENWAMSEGAKDTYAEFEHNIVKFASRITPIRSESVLASRSFEGTVGLVFFDGDHSYNGIKADWEAWYPRLSSESIVIFHDIGWAEGVQRVVEDFVAPRATKCGRLPNLYWAWIKR